MRLETWHKAPNGGVRGQILTAQGVRRVRYHRLIIERELGRRLGAREKVIHLNGDLGDNRRANLLHINPEDLDVLTFCEATFRYDPSGRLFYRRAVPPDCSIGDEAGWIEEQNGYRWVGICGRRFAVHRLIWAMHNGRLPGADKVVDHINRDRLDNRICNLRECTAAENARNVVADRVSFHAASGLWRARVNKNGQEYCRYLKSRKQAIVAAKQMHAELGGEFSPYHGVNYA